MTGGAFGCESVFESDFGTDVDSVTGCIPQNGQNLHTPIPGNSLLHPAH
jgi:hypothetical protein